MGRGPTILIRGQKVFNGITWPTGMAPVTLDRCEKAEAYVTAVTRADGNPAVLKLHVPRPGHAARHEITVFRLTAGVGSRAGWRGRRVRRTVASAG